MRGFRPRIVDEIAQISKLRNFRNDETLFDKQLFADNLYLFAMSPAAENQETLSSTLRQRKHDDG